MKIAIISTPALSAILSHSWRMARHDVIEIKVNPQAMMRDRNVRNETATKICEILAAENPSMVLDIDGAGMLPLDPDATTWINEKVRSFRCVYWCEWWWHDPRDMAMPLRDEDELAGFYRAFKHDHTVHFMWDEVVAREFTQWTGKPFHWLPLATHPSIFSQAMAEKSDALFNPVQLSFAGTFYHKPPKPYFNPDIEDVAQTRLKYPDLSYLEYIDLDEHDMFEEFCEKLESLKDSQYGPFDPELILWKQEIDNIVGSVLRSEVLIFCQEHFKHVYFAGSDWPEECVAYPPLSKAADLSNRYQSALFNLAPPSKYAFSGLGTRAYEIMACGGVMVCHGFPDIDPLGKHADKAYLTYEEPGDILEKWKYYGSRLDKRQKIAENAQMFISNEHTWQHRLKTLLDMLMKQAGTRK